MAQGYQPMMGGQGGMNMQGLLMQLLMQRLLQQQGGQQQPEKKDNTGKSIGKSLREAYDLYNAPSMAENVTSAAEAINSGYGSGVYSPEIISNVSSNPTVYGAYDPLAATPQAGFMSNLGVSGMGAGPGALGAIGAGAYLNNIWEGGGKDIIKGKGKKEDYTNLALDINPVTAPINMIGRALGFKSVGRSLFGPSLKDQNKDKFDALQKAGIQMHTDKAGYFDGGPGKKVKEDNQLGVEDIWGAMDMYKHFGNDWLGKYSENDRRAISDAALKAGAVKQEKGDIAIDWNKVGDVNQILSGQSQSPAPIDPATNYETQYKSFIGKDDKSKSKRKNPTNQSIDIKALKNKAGDILGSIPKLTNGAKINTGIQSGLAFDPNSDEYGKLSKDQKNEYWNLRNAGR